jgi:hypothetical protein
VRTREENSKMSLFFDNNYSDQHRMNVETVQNAEQMPKRGFFINVREKPVAKKKNYDNNVGIEQWHHLPQAALTLTRRRNNLNISPGEIKKRESFTKTTSMKWVRKRII